MRKEVRRVTEDRLFYPVDPGFVLNRGNVLEAG